MLIFAGCLYLWENTDYQQLQLATAARQLSTDHDWHERDGVADTADNTEVTNHDGSYSIGVPGILFLES